jgi:uncharacterized protein YecE (DUF72 family)
VKKKTPAPPANPVTQEARDCFALFVKKWQELLGLRDWRIEPSSNSRTCRPRTSSAALRPRHPEWDHHRLLGRALLAGHPHHCVQGLAAPDPQHAAAGGRERRRRLRRREHQPLPAHRLGPTPSIIQELKACDAALGEIEEAAKKARHNVQLPWCLGNHDARFENRLAANAPQYEQVHGFSLKDHFPAWRPCWAVWNGNDGHQAPLQGRHSRDAQQHGELGREHRHGHLHS